MGVQIPPSAPLIKNARNLNRLRFFNFYRLRLGCVWLRVQTVHSLAVATWNQVPVDVHGHLNGTVPHLLLDVNGCSPIAQKQTCEGMSNIMKANVPKSCFL